MHPLAPEIEIAVAQSDLLARFRFAMHGQRQGLGFGQHGELRDPDFHLARREVRVDRVLAAADHPACDRNHAFGSQGFGETLTELLEIHLEDRQIAMAEYKLALLNRPEAARGLRIVHAGQGIGNAADALAGERFELLIEVARDLFDLVLVSGGPVGDPDAHVLAQRVDSAILVGSAGHTAVSRVETAAREFAGFRANLLGMVLIRRRRGRLGRWAHSISRARFNKLAARTWQSVKKAKVWKRIRKSWAASAPRSEDD